ncbi:MAG: ATP synthase F0 subunit A [Bacteroidetes bacterium GWF2_33_16]|nr:MAG: ATP synthase F0 subunit A [Bacteroidetes bacterium GWE2_32_14]OFY04752.1 MAG: ATP synthase F0 subunit A [Bacteroidetes bacterium GWF2_33_16]
MIKAWLKIFSVLLLLLFFSNISLGEEKQIIADTSEHKLEEKKKFDVGEFIFDHILDHYGWHIITYNHKHISIPLPVILYSNNQGWISFWSSKIDHGHVYKGFKIDLEGKNKGKIIEINQDGVFLEKPFDISITKNVLAILISSTILLFVFVSVAKTYKQRVDMPPKGLQSFLEPVILFVRDDIAKSSINEKNYEKFTPFLLTIFFFILLNNLMGLVPFFPGGANVTGNITVTLVLALFTFVITTINGNKGYWKHIFNAPGVPWWLKVPLPLIPFIELAGLLTKPFVLMIRLFANISAGHIIVLGFFSLIFIFGNINAYAGFGASPVSILFTIFMSILELLVSFIQAYVFTFLSALYFGMAVEEHH